MLSFLRTAATAVVASFQKVVTGIGLVMIALTIVGGVVAVHYRAKAAVTAAEAAAAEHTVAVARDSVRVVSARAIAAEQRGDSLLAVAARASRAAGVDSAQLAVLRARFVQLASAAPSACADVATSAASALGESDSVASHLTTKADSDSAAAAYFRAALDSTRAANAALLAADTHADSTRAAAAKPEPFLARIKPHWGVGFAAGVNLSGKPEGILGVTYGWRW